MTTPDAGDDADAGQDAGSRDAGEDADAGQDAGSRDAGEDARAGQDAGTAARGDRVPSSDEDSDVAAGVDPSELTGPERRLDPRIRFVWIAQSVLFAAVLGAIAGTLGLAIDYGPLVGVAAFAVVAALGVTHSVLRYRSWRYQVRDDSLYLERGVLTHVKTVVPYVRIQHVDASRGPLERLLGLASSVVYTAGSRGADVTIPGLTPARSEELQARLKQLAIAAEGDDAV